MKKLVVTFLTLIMLAAGASAQSEIPAYRAKGYKGSVSYSNIGLLWSGLETSHGYMFNEKFYLGGGLGVKLFPFGKQIVVASPVFAEAQAYWFPRKSTLTSGVRLGYLHNFSGDSYFEADVTVGWSWGFASGQGLTLNAGLTTVPSEVSITIGDVQISPLLSVAFEF